MTQEERVLKHLEQHGSITSLEMFDKFYICCPQGIIRNIRKKFGYDYIADLWCSKKRTEKNSEGKERTVTGVINSILSTKWRGLYEHKRRLSEVSLLYVQT